MKAFLAAGAIILAAAAVYLPATRAGFVWNDEDLTHNIVLGEDGLFRVWFTTDSTNYWPLVWTSYWLEHQLWGLNPAGYHIVNIALHALAAVLVWRVLRRLRIPAAWFAALLFAVHPVNVESVAWITQRKNCLCMVFYLAALLSFLRHEDRDRPGTPWAAVLLFLLAMLSKGAAAGLPLVLLLCLWWRQGAVSARDVVRTLPFFGVAVAMAGVEIWFQYVRAIGETVVREDSFAARLTGAGWVIWFYLGKSLLPLDLTFVYPRWEINPTDWMAHLPNLTLLAIAALAWRFRRGWGRSVLFALSYYIVMLAPVLGFLNIYFMRYSFVADHYQYLAIVAPITLVTAAGAVLAGRWGRPARLIATAGALSIAGVLGWLSWQQTHAYHNAETLWRDTIRKNPDAWLAHYNLGLLLRARAELEQAARHFAETFRIQPDDAWAHHNLAVVRQQQGRTDEAVHHYREALRLDPRLARSYSNLGDLRALKGDLTAAVSLYRQALEIDPALAETHNNLGVVLEQLQRTHEAARHFRLALRLQPENAQAHVNLGRFLLRRGDRETAAAHFREAVRLDPQLAPSLEFAP